MWRLGFVCVKYEYFRHAGNVASNSTENTNNNAINPAAMATRMSHIMIFVTRKDLPPPVAPTVETYHPAAGLPTSSEEVVDYGSIGKTAEEIEQLWIKQDLEPSLEA